MKYIFSLRFFLIVFFIFHQSVLIGMTPEPGSAMEAANLLEVKYKRLFDAVMAARFYPGMDFFCQFRTDSICKDLARLLYKFGEEKSIASTDLIVEISEFDAPSEIASTIKLAEDLIEEIKTIGNVNPDQVLDVVNGLIKISDIIEKMASIPSIKHVDYKGFDANIAFVESDEVIPFHSPCIPLRCRDNVAKLIRDMKAKHAYISELIKQLLRTAVSKTNNDALKTKLDEIEKAGQDANLKEVMDLVGAEGAKKLAEDALAKLTQQKATDSEIVKAKADLLVKTKLAEKFSGMDKQTKEILVKTIKPEELSKVELLLKKIKADCESATKKKQSLSDDIQKTEFEFEGQKIPGLHKSLNTYLSDATFGIFIQIFQEIKSYLESENVTEIQKQAIFNALSFPQDGAKKFLFLIYLPGISGSSNIVRDEIKLENMKSYKNGAVSLENLIKLINAYREMCVQSGSDVSMLFSEGTKSFDKKIEELNIFSAFLVKEAQERTKKLEDAAREAAGTPGAISTSTPGTDKKETDVADKTDDGQGLAFPPRPGDKGPAFPPRPGDKGPAFPPRPGADAGLKPLLSSLKRSLQEVRIKTELLHGKLVLLKDKLG